jgi:cell division protein FtsB
MKGARLVLLLSVGFLLRSLSLFLWGSGGLSDYRKVEAGRGQLAANIEELKRINSGLRREVDSLGSDPQRVVLEARRLGYFREGQRVVRFQGEARQPSSFTLGGLVRVQLPRERRDWIWKMAGVILPLAAYVGWALRRKLRPASAAVLGGRSSGKASTPVAVLGGRSSGKASEDRRS